MAQKKMFLFMVALIFISVSLFSQITLNTNFKPNIASPLDLRFKITALSDTSNTNLMPFPYVGAITYVSSLNKYYYRASSGWTELLNWSLLVGVPSYLDNDTLTTNELIDSVRFNQSNKVLTIYEKSNTKSDTITGFLTSEVDGSITNELQTIDTFNILSNMLRLSLSNDGQPFKSVNLAPYLDNVTTNLTIEDAYVGSAIKVNSSDGTDFYLYEGNSINLTTALGGADKLAIIGVADGGISTTQIENNSVTNGKLAQMSANTLKGNNTGSNANPTDISVNTNSVIGRAGSNITNLKIGNGLSISGDSIKANPTNDIDSINVLTGLNYLYAKTNSINFGPGLITESISGNGYDAARIKVDSSLFATKNFINIKDLDSLRFDSITKILCLYQNGIGFCDTVNITGGSGVGTHQYFNSSSTPSSPNAGDFWFNYSTLETRVYNGTEWLMIVDGDGDPVNELTEFSTYNPPANWNAFINNLKDGDIIRNNQENAIQILNFGDVETLIDFDDIAPAASIDSTTVSDSGTIDFTESGNNITAIVKTNSIDSTHLKVNSVSTTRIVDGSVTPSKLSQTYLTTEVDGSVTNEKISSVQFNPTNKILTVTENGINYSDTLISNSENYRITPYIQGGANKGFKHKQDTTTKTVVRFNVTNGTLVGSGQQNDLYREIVIENQIVTSQSFVLLDSFKYMVKPFTNYQYEGVVYWSPETLSTASTSVDFQMAHSSNGTMRSAFAHNNLLNTSLTGNASIGASTSNNTTIRSATFKGTFTNAENFGFIQLNTKRGSSGSNVTIHQNSYFIVKAIEDNE